MTLAIIIRDTGCGHCLISMRASSEQGGKADKHPGDAEAARIYGEAAGKDPGFYAFQRSLEAYRKAFDDGNAVIVLDKNDPFLQYMHSDR